MANESLFFDKTMERLKFLVICSGLNLEPSKRHKIKKRWVYIFNFIWLNSDIIQAVFWIIDGVLKGTDMTDLTYVTPCALLSAVATVKSLYFIFYEDRVESLIDKLRQLDKGMNVSDNAMKSEIEGAERKFLNFVINLFNIFNIGMVVTFTLSPLIQITIKYIRTGELELMLPFLNVYPFDTLNIKYWPLVYVKQISSECIVLVQLCVVDYFYYICCSRIRIQFRLLRHEIENFMSDGKTTKEIQKVEIQKFSKLVKWHQDIIISSDTLEVIYSKSTLFNFVSSSVIICLTGFNVTAIDNVALAVTFLTFLFMSLLQIFFLCLFGDMIMRSSLEVSFAVYNCLWYAAGGRKGKDLLIVIIRSQKPCKLTAFGFADVNLRAFTKIISTAWSYFALIKSMYNSNQE